VRNRILTLAIVLLFSLVSFVGKTAAVPMQRVITVINQEGQIICENPILYSNTYKQPALKITTTQNAAPNQLSSRSENGDVRLVLKTASDLLGSSYVYGASGPRSFDCSGFTMYVYKKVGITLPHMASSQFNYGKKVARGDLAQGDLVFFSYYGQSGIDHVGIYAGDGMFIHASSTNKGVITTSMNSSYYVKNYKGAVRILR